jgi:DNA-binding beta-propeller fold protein YncE
MRAPPVAVLALLLAGCGGATRPAPEPRPAAPPAGSRAVAVSARPAARLLPARAQALITAETENQLLVADLPGGRVIRRIRLPDDPENVASSGKGGVVVVVSSGAGKVTLLDRDTLRPLRVLGGFASAHIPAFSPDGGHAYVTDDARGTLTAIRLSDAAVTSTVLVGAGAHHLSFSPDQRRLWIALGESARQIAILNTSDPDRPRLINQFTPGFLAHDLSFTPDGGRVWITSASGPDVAVFDARDHRLLFRVRVGPAPQHVVFYGRAAYLTSGYGSVIERVDTATGRVLERTGAPYGSFELDAAHGYVTSASLLRGTLAVYNTQLRQLSVHRLAPTTRDLAVLP